MTTRRIHKEATRSQPGSPISRDFTVCGRFFNGGHSSGRIVTRWCKVTCRQCVRHAGMPWRKRT